MIKAYFSEIEKLLHHVLQNEEKTMTQAAELIYQSLSEGGNLFVFGCGHSHMLAEEVFFRAGGLANVYPILEESVMLHEGAVTSSTNEKTAQFAASFIDKYPITEKDAVIIVSTSGKNPVPIDVALYAKQQGAKTVALTSKLYIGVEAAKHESGKYLAEVVDIAINNFAPIGDGLLKDERFPATFAPGSTVIGTTIINAVIGDVVKRFIDAGQTPPVFMSSNVQGGGEYNEKLIVEYFPKIPFLK